MESSKPVLACQGERLALTCSGTARSQQWNVFHGNETAHNHVVAILLPNTVHPQEITVNQVLFRFSITSVSPLMSTVIIDNVTSNANGVRLVCTHSAGMSTSRTINVVASNGSLYLTMIACFVILFVHLDAHSNCFNSVYRGEGELWCQQYYSHP